MERTSVVSSSAPSGAAEQSTRYCVAPWAAFQLSLMLLWLSSETRRERGADRGTGREMWQKDTFSRSAAAPAPEESWLYNKLGDTRPASNTATCQGVGLIHLQPKGRKGTRVVENFCLGCVSRLSSAHWCHLQNDIGGMGHLRISGPTLLSQIRGGYSGPCPTKF